MQSCDDRLAAGYATVFDVEPRRHPPPFFGIAITALTIMSTSPEILTPDVDLAQLPSTSRAWWRNREFWVWSVILFVQTAPFESLFGGTHATLYLREAIGALCWLTLLTKKEHQSAYVVSIWPFALFILYSAISSLLKSDALWSLKTLAVFITVAGPLAAMAYRLRPTDFCRVIAIVFVLSCLISIVVVFAYPSVGVTPVRSEAGVDNVGGWRGVYQYKNQLGHVAGITAGVMLFSGLPLFKNVRLWILALTVSAICTLGSLSSTAIILAITLPAFYIAAVKPRGLFRVLSFTLVAIAFIALLLDRDQLVHATLGVLGKNSSLSGRTGIWALGGEYFRDQPAFGGGFGLTATDEFHQRLKALFGVEYTHNQYLEVLLNGGLVGFSLYLFMVAEAAWLAWRRVVPERLAPARNFLSVLLLGWAISAWSETSNDVLADIFFAIIFGLWGVGARVSSHRATLTKSRPGMGAGAVRSPALRRAPPPKPLN